MYVCMLYHVIINQQIQEATFYEYNVSQQAQLTVFENS